MTMSEMSASFCELEPNSRNGFWRMTELVDVAVGVLIIPLAKVDNPRVLSTRDSFMRRKGTFLVTTCLYIESPDYHYTFCSLS